MQISRRALLEASSVGLGYALMPSLVANAARQESVSVTMVTDTAGLGDQNFNDLANRGGERAAEELGVNFSVLESQSAADYIPNLTRAAEGSTITVAVGALLIDATVEVAGQYPDSRFSIIDAGVEADNLLGITFREQEGGFLAGIIAALMVGPEKKLGVVGGIRVPPVMRYEVGFVAGVHSIDPTIEVIISYADSFEDPALGKELTLAQYNQGANIVFPIAGRTGVGSFDAAKEKGEGFWVIGADADQSHLGPEHQLFAVKKAVDDAMFESARFVVEGEFEGGVKDWGLWNDAVGLIVFHESVPEEFKSQADGYKQAIIDGTIVPPVDDDTLAAFEPAALPNAASPAASPEATPAG